MNNELVGGGLCAGFPGRRRIIRSLAVATYVHDAQGRYRGSKRVQSNVIGKFKCH